MAEPSLSFDVFMSHNSGDKPVVRELISKLEPYRLNVWYDEDQLPPGVPWQPLLEKGMRDSRSVAVLVGGDGLGPWEDQEMQAALNMAVRDGRPVIPVLLPDAPGEPDLPLFLANRTWVDFRGGFATPLVERLVWGITGVKPDGLANSSNSATDASPTDRPRRESNALAVWREKLAYLQEQEPLLTSPDQKFALKKSIEEALEKIAELEH